MSLGQVPAIQLQEVSKTYVASDGSDLVALSPLSFDIRQGEFVSVIGPSGCGKTTLLRIMAGLDQATEGAVLFNGGRSAGPRRDVGVAFQNPDLLEWRTILQNILLPAEIAHLNAKAAREHAMELLELSGLASFADRYPHELSGGMQQRAALVRALVLTPSFLLLDEPFGALDALTREMMNVVLARLTAATNITALLITHSIEEAVFLSDAVMVLGPRPGRLLGVLDIEIPRPRSVTTFESSEFGVLTAELRRFFIEDVAYATASHS